MTVSSPSARYPDRGAMRRMAQYDALPPEWRALVNAYGLPAIIDARGRRWTPERTISVLEAERVRLQYRQIGRRRNRCGGRIASTMDSLKRFLAERAEMDAP